MKGAEFLGEPKRKNDFKQKRTKQKTEMQDVLIVAGGGGDLSNEAGGPRVC